MLHVDAKRIFGIVDDADGSKWDSQYDVKYKSFKQAHRHSKRDGTAFASVALPAHFSAIYSVLDHVKQRLGPEWQVERVIDWGAGTGSGLWFVIFPHTQATTDKAIVGHQRAAFRKLMELIWRSCPLEIPRFRVTWESISERVSLQSPDACSRVSSPFYQTSPF